MAHIDSVDISNADSRMTVRFAGGELLAAPLTARVDTDSGEVTFHTDPASLNSAGCSGATTGLSRDERPRGDEVGRGDLIRGASIAFLVAPEGVEEIELTAPWAAVRDAGATPVLVSTVSGTVQAFRHLDRAGEYPVDYRVGEVDAADFDALVLPGGVANPDYLRTRHDAVDLVEGFFAIGRPVAAICHAPWTLIEAGVVPGRRLTSWPSLRTDLVNAGARWVDEELVICDVGPNTLVTSRGPDDLSAFCDATVHATARSIAARNSAGAIDAK